MSDSYYERLSAMDAMFLEIEDENVHMHMGGVAIFEAAPAAGSQIRTCLFSGAYIAARKHPIPMMLILASLGRGGTRDCAIFTSMAEDALPSRLSHPREGELPQMTPAGACGIPHPASERVARPARSRASGR